MPDSSERIGRYQLLEPIGGGPTGSVWRAKVFGVAGFERQFAIKRFHPELTAAPSTAQALSAAARSYGSLEHPRIARMSEFGVAQGQTFTAVELVAGLDAARLVADAKANGFGLPPGGSLALISQVARAVGYAHGRGLSHLGIAPSNVIVTVEGDVKVTDFGILAATISAHPVEAPRLAPRIGYIAPEQLVGEATSAATDVYVLGVIAYELVTGQRAFFGDTPQAVAQAILAGPPADPPLPRPIVRVLTRCLARSQFERFPDARAFADALDAALRVAPVPGTRKEVGAQVKAALDRHAAMNDGTLSGMVSLSLIASPTPPGPEARPSEDSLSTSQFVRPDAPVPRPTPLVGPRTPARDPGATMPELPKPMLTVPGVVPPIPVPQGIGGSQPVTSPPASPPAAQTMLGISASKRPIPSVPGRVPAIPSIARTPTSPGKGTVEIPKIAPKFVEPQQATTATHTAMEERIARLAEQVPQTADEPATAPYAMISEDDALLDEIAPPAARPKPAVPKESAPSIQVIRGSAPDLPESRQLPTNEMAPDLVRELKRISSDAPYANDPLVELSLEPLVATPDSTRRPTPDSTRRPTPPATPAAVRERDGDETVREGASPLPRRSGAPTQEVSFEAPTREVSLYSAASSAPGAASSASGAASSTPGAVSSAPTAVPSSSASANSSASRSASPLAGSLDPSASGPSSASAGAPPMSPRATPPREVAVSDAPSISESGRARDAAPLRRMPSPSPPSLVQPPLAGAASPGGTILGIASSPLPGLQPPATSGLASPGAPPHTTTPGIGPPPPAPSFTLPSVRPRRRWPVVAVVALVAGGGGVAAWQLTKSEEAPSSASPGSAGLAAAGSAKANAAGSATAGSAMVTTTAGSAALANVDPAALAKAGSATHVDPAALAKAGSATHAGSASLATSTGSAAAAPSSAGSAATNATATNAGSAAVARTGSAAPTAAGSATPPPRPTGTPTTDALQITSTPSGARVFIDGADQGVTPVKLAGTSDRHTMALLLAGHDLYVAEVDGHGSFSIPLTQVTPSGGPAGIKVIRCKDKDRYYVFVDGKATGMTCPTERIECTTGPHTVEVYDVVTETRRKWDITVTDTRLSYRVRIE